jgi:hypothetical protein
MVARMTSGSWIISHRWSWITVYVLCCNAQVNLIVTFMTCTCIAVHSLFCQFPNCNLFTQHVIYLYGETPLVNCGPRFILLHLYYCLLSTSIIYFLANKYLLPHDTFNLTASWGKVLWLCCVQVPRCCWHQSNAQTCAINKFSRAIAKAS